MAASSFTSTPTFTETARRAQIVEAAIVTLNDLGYHRASLAEIARRAGVAKSALLYYFGSRDALLLHVMDVVYTGLDEAVAARVAAEKTPEEQLRGYAEAYVAYVDGHRAALTAGTEIVVAHRDPDGVPLYLTGSDEDSARLQSILAAGMDAGVFRRMPLSVALRLVEALVDLPIFAVQRDPDADLTDIGREMVDFVMRGLAPDA